MVRGSQTVRNSSVTIGASSTVAVNEAPTGLRRVQVIITNTSAAAVATVVKSNVAAIAGSGIVLQPNGTFLEADDGGYSCWQGQIQVVGTAAGSVAVVEAFVEK